MQTLCHLAATHKQHSYLCVFVCMLVSRSASEHHCIGAGLLFKICKRVFVSPFLCGHMTWTNKTFWLHFLPWNQHFTMHIHTPKT